MLLFSAWDVALVLMDGHVPFFAASSYYEITAFPVDAIEEVWLIEDPVMLWYFKVQQPKMP